MICKRLRAFGQCKGSRKDVGAKSELTHRPSQHRLSVSQPACCKQARTQHGRHARRHSPDLGASRRARRGFRADLVRDGFVAPAGGLRPQKVEDGEERRDCGRRWQWRTCRAARAGAGAFRFKGLKGAKSAGPLRGGREWKVESRGIAPVRQNVLAAHRREAFSACLRHLERFEGE